MALSTVFHSVNLPTTLRFLTLFFRSYLCLTDPLNYISLYEYLFMKVSFSPDIIPCGWLGSNHQFTSSTSPVQQPTARKSNKSVGSHVLKKLSNFRWHCTWVDDNDARWLVDSRSVFDARSAANVTLRRKSSHQIRSKSFMHCSYHISQYVWRDFGEEMKLSESGRQKLEWQISCHRVKHAKLDAELLQAWGKESLIPSRGKLKFFWQRVKDGELGATPLQVLERERERDLLIDLDSKQRET